jgi:hypothetical protein
MLHGDSKCGSDDDDASPARRSPRSLQEKWIPEVYAREIELEERLVVELMRRSEVRKVWFFPLMDVAPTVLRSCVWWAVRPERDHVQAR